MNWNMDKPLLPFSLSASIGNLQQFLSKLQVEEVKQPFTMERFKLGQSNPTFLITGAE